MAAILNTVVTVARAVADGLLAGGVLPVLKHIPGHGLARVDSHLDLPRVSASENDLRQRDFAAFEGVERPANGNDRTSGVRRR